MTNMAEGRRFYTDLLGFKISDVMDYSKRAASPEQVAGHVLWCDANAGDLRKTNSGGLELATTRGREERSHLIRAARQQ